MRRAGILLAMATAVIGENALGVKYLADKHDTGFGDDTVRLGRRAEKSAEVLRKAEAKRERRCEKRVKGAGGWASHAGTGR